MLRPGAARGRTAARIAVLMVSTRSTSAGSPSPNHRRSESYSELIQRRSKGKDDDDDDNDAQEGALWILPCLATVGALGCGLTAVRCASEGSFK